MPFGLDTSSGSSYPGATTQFGPSSSLRAVESATTLLADPNLSPIQKALGMQLIADAADNNDGVHFQTSDLIRAGLGARLGYGAAAITGKVLGAVFGLPPNNQKQL